MKFFDDLGRYVHDAYRRASFDPRAFPAIATEALERRLPSEHVSYEEIVDALLAHDLPAQPKQSGFGQPQIVVFHGERFYIEVLCWMEATTDIHQHCFSGAFHVLAGSSVHSVYDFEPRQRINTHLQLGKLTNRHCELLRRGAVRTIAAGSAFIHALFHLDEPSISVVLRTHGDVDQFPQYSYREGIAITPLDDTEDRTTPPAMMVLRMLAATNPAAYLARARRIVETSDPWTTHHVLEHVFRSALGGVKGISEEAANQIYEAARRSGDPAVIDAFLASHRRAARVAALTSRRKQVRDRELRYFLALLLNVPDRAKILDLVRSWTDADPLEMVRRWLQQLTSVRSASSVSLLEVELELEGESLPGVSLDALMRETIGAMLGGWRGKELVAKVRGRLPPLGEDEEDLVLHLEAELAKSSLAPLFC